MTIPKRTEELLDSLDVFMASEEPTTFSTRTSTWVEANLMEEEILQELGKIEQMLQCSKCGQGCDSCYNNMPLCSPGKGCNSHWNPGSESPEQKIQDHDNWASQTDHGQYAMPGEGPKPQAPWAAHSSVNSDW